MVSHSNWSTTSIVQGVTEYAPAIINRQALESASAPLRVGITGGMGLSLSFDRVITVVGWGLVVLFVVGPTAGVFVDVDLGVIVP